MRERRSTLHRGVARAIVETDAGRLDERAALLATHFEKAGDGLEAARWNNRAADFAVRHDLGESTRRWMAALDHLAAAPEDEEALRIKVRSLYSLIRFGARTGMDSHEARRLYADATAAVARLGGAAELLPITFAYGSNNFWRGAIGDALNIYLRAARLADEIGDAAARAAYWASPAMCQSWTGPVEQTLDLVEMVEALCDGNPGFGAGVHAWSPLTAVAFARAEMLSLLGRLEEARAVVDGLVAGARQRSEVEFVAWGLSILPRIARSESELEASLEAAREAARAVEAAGNTAGLVIALGGVGHAEGELGRFADAATSLDRALDLGRRHHTGLFEEARILADLARARLGLGDSDGARRAASDAVEVAHRQKAPVMDCVALLSRARITRAIGGRATDVVADLAAALAVAREIGAIAFEAEIEAARAEARSGSQ